MKKYLLLSLLCMGFFAAMAQNPPRLDDHFWRRKVVNRIDLNEKVNRPLVKRESPFYTDNSQYTEKEGLIMALFNGLKHGKFVAYHPDSLQSALSYEEVLQRIKEIDGSMEAEAAFDEGEGADEFGDGGFDDFGGDEWGFETDDFGGEDFDDLGGDELALPGGEGFADFDPGPFEQVVHFVEDRIFDKTRSDMVYDIEYIEIIWVDPGETLPEKTLCTFAYEEVSETLDNTQWKNRFNDAAYKTLKEIFELRLFNSYVINVSGEGIRSLEEAEYRRQRMVEFEHHLWSY